ncbi:hypothetical protein [Cyanobium sp. NIES-981]|uniref:hypothetical protein n=1 Tax=Cyanobium sp. NIES-981 TaxID=1851505 RepID=UPI000B34C788|nr:hypothetical protein [Cyanobium sp. NIES-981]
MWLALLGLLLLAPSPAGRVLLDVVGGITLTLLLLPLLLGGLGLIAWQVLRRRLTVCPACGFMSVGAEVCPACGTALGQDSASPGDETQVFGGREVDQEARNVKASSATIDVEVVSSQAIDDEN